MTSLADLTNSWPNTATNSAPEPSTTSSSENTDVFMSATQEITTQTALPTTTANPTTTTTTNPTTTTTTTTENHVENVTEATSTNFAVEKFTNTTDVENRISSSPGPPGGLIQNPFLWSAVAVVVLGLCIAAVIILQRLWRGRVKRRNRVQKRDSTTQLVPRYSRWSWAKETSAIKPAIANFDDVTVWRRPPVTCGCFGAVYEGEMINKEGTPMPVCLKIVPNSAVKDFNRNLEVLTQLRSHPNLVCLLGTVTDPRSGDWLMVLDHVREDLKTFLEGIRRKSLKWNITVSRISLIGACVDVAKGMVYLTTRNIKSVIPLSAQTVVMDTNNVAKISGYANFYEESTDGYLLHNQVPQRWAAPESFMYNTVNFMSFIWSFGVLMWEVFTLGDTPYMDIDSKELYRQIRNGHRLCRTRFINDKMYSLMLRCWEEDYHDRPTFLEVLSDLEDVMNNSERYIPGYGDFNTYSLLDDDCVEPSNLYTSVGSTSNLNEDYVEMNGVTTTNMLVTDL